MTRVLVVDDSALMRRLVRDVLDEAGGYETAFAADGEEALALIRTFAPDVVTLDINMPRMDGLACLDRIMLEKPTPVIMVSAMTAEGADQSVEALSLGAVDVLQKPSGPQSLGISSLGPVLVQKIEAAKGARIRGAHRLSERLRILTGKASEEPPRRRRPVAVDRLAAGRFAVDTGDLGLVLVGCSTGGPSALDHLLPDLPPDFPWPIVVAQHMPATFTGPLARRLAGICRLTVMEVVQPTELKPGVVHIAHGDADIIIAQRPGGLIATPTRGSPDYVWHPSVDRLVASAMAVLPPSALIGVLMSGMGHDGAATMTELRAGGGWTLAEAEETAVVWGMPGELVRAGGAAEVAPLEGLASRLTARLASR